MEVGRSCDQPHMALAHGGSHFLEDQVLIEVVHTSLPLLEARSQIVLEE